jgi:hypothetical protein
VTPHQVKQKAVVAWERSDASAALTVCGAIATDDLYIAAPRTSEGDAVWRTTKTVYGPKPCQRGCGYPVQKGELALWHRNLGVRHITCPGTGDE